MLNGRPMLKRRHGTSKGYGAGAEVIAEALKKKLSVHLGRLMDLCHLKHAELNKEVQKYKGRVVFRGDQVKDETGFHAVFTEQGASASQMQRSPWG